MNWKQEYIAELAQEILSQGFRVFIAENGTHGFYTDEVGTRVISFQLNYLHPSFSGNYITDNPRSTGTGWQIKDGTVDDYDDVFYEYPPAWAVGDAKWRYSTLQDHLDRYQQSSKYEEVSNA